MSYHTWHEYGYGFRLSDLSKESVTKIYNFFEFDYNEYADTWDLGEKLVNELNDINQTNGFMFCFDYNGLMYIMYSTGYPWRMSDNDKSMTEHKVKDTITSYMKTIIGIDDFDDNLIGYQEVESGG